MYRSLYRFLAAMAWLAVRSGRSKDLESIVLRHQLMAVRRQDSQHELNIVDRTALVRSLRHSPRQMLRRERRPRHPCCASTSDESPALDPTHRRTRQTVNRH